MTEEQEEIIFQELMTSDFNDHSDHDTWRNRIFLFRKYYKMLYAKYKNSSSNNELLTKDLNEHRSNENRLITQMKNELWELRNENEKLKKPKKLTLVERFKGMTKQDI